MENNISTTPNKTQITSAPNKTQITSAPNKTQNVATPTKSGRHRHTFIATVIKPTCKEGGRTLYRCSVEGCREQYEDDYVFPTPHKFSDWYEEKRATCTEPGTEVRECENEGCDVIETRAVTAKGHFHKNWRTLIEPTCEKPGEKDSICSGCGKDYKKETLPALGHTYGEWKQVGDKLTSTCTKCGKTETIPFPRSGKLVTFGQYPQSEVTDSTLKKTLSNLAGALPTSNNGNGWTSYKYYIGKKKDGNDSSNNGSGSNSTDFMWYKDVTHNGERYRGVYFTKYRPYYCSYESTEGNTYQKSNGYTPSTLYWFKYEPIQWCILEEKNGYATLLAKKIIDSQDYYHDDYSDTETRNGKPVYANNYAQSDIRAWLNDLFYRTAFTSEQQSLIQAVTIDNSADSTTDTKGSASKATSYACENTTDKVWLLSVREVANTGYGFNADYYNGKDSARQKEGTAYAKCNGLWINSGNGKCVWWLRSPYYDNSYFAWYVYSDGSGDYRYVRYTYYGVAPALKIRLS